MFNRLRNAFAFERGTWKVNPDSLNYRIYRWWLANTESRKTPSWGYRENFCHYWRVVLLWSPLLWFFVVPIFQYGRLSWGWGWIRPWMVTTGIMVVAAFVYAILFSPQLLNAFVVLGVTVLVMLVIIGCAIGIHLVSKSETIERVLAWFFTSHKWGIVYPWSVTLVALVALGLLTLGAKTTWEVIFTTLIVVGVFIGLALVGLIGLGILYGVWWLLKTGWNLLIPSRRRLHPVRPASRRTPARPRETGMSTAGIVARAVWAQHNRICPLVELPDEDTNFSW